MRVIHVADYGGPYAGSFVPMLRAVAATVRERGGTVEIAFTPVARDRPWLAELEADDVPVSFAPPGDRRTRARFLAELINDREPAVLHTHFTSFDLPAVSVARARAPSPPPRAAWGRTSPRTDPRSPPHG
jgi:hypothetical protein